MLYLLEELTVFALLIWNVLDESLVALEIFLWFQDLNVIFSSAFLAKVQLCWFKFDTPFQLSSTLFLCFTLLPLDVKPSNLNVWQKQVFCHCIDGWKFFVQNNKQYPLVFTEQIVTITPLYRKVEKLWQQKFLLQLRLYET